MCAYDRFAYDGLPFGLGSDQGLFKMYNKKMYNSSNFNKGFAGTFLWKILQCKACKKKHKKNMYH